ncbi:pyridoxamine 5'-phosphate oxidase family protein [Kribbella sancticallisti]|uniref:Pyridoxamine 5'-phosphate oxidase family protein n=1 Tax=Kribbella sancticallisti TaxID=460087 RepID=A0ABP4QRW8_9ACTN
MTIQYHPGERLAQRLAGLRAEAEMARPAIGTSIPAVAAQFVTEQHLLVLGAADPDGRLWASPLVGDPGFVTAPDEYTLDVAAVLAEGDPLRAALAELRQVGVILIDPSTRRRMRVNGDAVPTPAGLRITVNQVYANCPKYIQQRRIHQIEPADVSAARVTDALDNGQRRLIATADTFFVATRSATGAADASHRGGNPGFVQVLGDRSLRWPDYVGNAMMMTLGNLQQDPAAGLLFVDWVTGTTLQVSGRAHVEWDADPGLPGAQRQIRIEVDRVVQLDHASPLQWTEPVPSRFNPPLPEGNPN